MNFERKEIVIKGTRTIYWEKGVANKRTIVMLHGFPGNHQGLIDMACLLEGYHVVLLDLPACGESEIFTIQHSLQNYAGWLKEFLQEKKIEHPIILGHSFGGRVALEFAARYPSVADSLILLMPVIKVDGSLTQISLRFAALLPDSLRAGIVRSRVYQYFLSHLLIKSGTSKQRRELYEANNIEVAHLDTRAFIEISDEVLARDLTSLAEKITVPTFVVAGGADVIATPESIKALSAGFRNASLHIAPKTGHVLPIEEPKVVADLIADWLKSRYHI